ncbi:MAG: CBS domain-containing protein [Candidatus Levyibacteriota bacterium]
MKVVDIMQKQVTFVSLNSRVDEASRLIFGQGINGLPVVKKKKLVGFLTEKDILSKFYPSMQDYMEDPVHMSDFEKMEKKAEEILALPVGKIMSKNPTCVSSDTPILKAQSTMLIKKIGRLPVIDKKGNLIGILTKGDIFKSVVGNKLPLEEEADFYDWMSTYFDVFNDWEERLSKEIPDLVSLFKKKNVKTVLDIGSSTGEHAIALAREGFNVIGIDASRLMCRAAEKKRSKLPEKIKKRIKFLEGSYKEVMVKIPKDIDAAIFMGNGLSHVMKTDRNILQEVVSKLAPKQGLLVLQTSNVKKIIEKNSGFKQFTQREFLNGQREIFISFYTNMKELTFSRAIFDYFEGKWSFRGIRTKSVANITKEDLLKILKKIGFTKISSYGSKNNGLLKEPFNPKESDWLNVVAKR